VVCGSDKVGQSGPGSEVKLSGKTEFHDRMDSSGSLFLQNGVVHSKHISLRELYKHQASVIAGLNNQEEESEDRSSLVRSSTSRHLSDFVITQAINPECDIHSFFRSSGHVAIQGIRLINFSATGDSSREQGYIAVLVHYPHDESLMCVPPSVGIYRFASDAASQSADSAVLLQPKDFCGPMQGDLRIFIFRKSEQDGKEQERICECWFHTLFLADESGVLSLKKSELDHAYKDTALSEDLELQIVYAKRNQDETDPLSQTDSVGGLPVHEWVSPLGINIRFNTGSNSSRAPSVVEHATQTDPSVHDWKVRYNFRRFDPAPKSLTERVYGTMTSMPYLIFSLSVILVDVLIRILVVEPLDLQPLPETISWTVFSLVIALFYALEYVLKFRVGIHRNGTYIIITAWVDTAAALAAVLLSVQEVIALSTDHSESSFNFTGVKLKRVNYWRVFAVAPLRIFVELTLFAHRLQKRRRRRIVVKHQHKHANERITKLLRGHLE